MARLSEDPYGQVSASWTQVSVPVPTAGTPVQVSATNVYVAEIEFHARKNKTTVNTGAVYIGPSNAPLRVLLPGEVWKVSESYTGNYNKRLNLADWWVDAATNGDAVTVTTRD